ncbi:TniQ family protein [Mesorhizobium sp. NPDC059054]|uniref:TniQ family protein n=1 Tax=Mesorhizobium sp. NPDC059054 TaxID=3346711 RepID=UPI0036B8AB2B
MSTLSLTVPFHADQSVTSFCSCLAAVNGIATAREFSRHMGFSFQKIVDGSDREISQLSALVELDEAVLAPGVIKKTAEGHDINSQVLTNQSLVRNRLRFCPHCIEEDYARNEGRPEARRYGRRNWLVSFIRTCEKHQSSLVESDQSSAGLYHDFSAMLRNEEPNLRELSERSVERPFSQFERYVSDRLAGIETEYSWLDGLPLYAALRITEMIGATANHGINFASKTYTDGQWWANAEAGFAVTSRGEDEIREFLSSLHCNFFKRRCAMKGNATYGRIYQWLAYETADAVYDPVRALIRDHAINNLPLGPGDDMFGPITHRRWHSVQSASVEYKLHPRRLRKLVLDAGLATVKSADASDNRILLPADTIADFIKTTRETIPAKDAQDYVNAPRIQFAILVENGYVKGHCSGAQDAGFYVQFAKSELDHFLKRLRDAVTYQMDISATMVSIPIATRRANCKAIEILDLLLNAKLKRVAWDPTERGFMAVRVDLDECKEKTRLADHGGLSLQLVMKKLSTTTYVLTNLIECGYLRASTVANPTNRCPQTVVMPDDLNAFMLEFVSLTNLAKERGEHFTRTTRWLSTFGVKPAFNPEKVRARFFRRSELPPN